MSSLRPRLSEVERECVSCGRFFKVPYKSKYELSKRATCRRKCENELRSWALTMAHRDAKQKPEAYRRWVGRDYSAMGKLRHEGKLQAGGKPHGT